MTSEYSNRIKYFDWPAVWHYDQYDDEQIEADRLGTTAEIKFLQTLIKQLKEETNDPQGSIVTITQPRSIL